ncbi:unnamed protein product [Peniophora sp. CBMAI 1063]|nr:unnamed protein product [Peniophora sp. CBMAI 1063]
MELYSRAIARVDTALRALKDAPESSQVEYAKIFIAELWDARTVRREHKIPRSPFMLALAQMVARCKPAPGADSDLDVEAFVTEMRDFDVSPAKEYHENLGADQWWRYLPKRRAQRDDRSTLFESKSVHTLNACLPVLPVVAQPNSRCNNDRLAEGRSETMCVAKGKENDRDTEMAASTVPSKTTASIPCAWISKYPDAMPGVDAMHHYKVPHIPSHSRPIVSDVEYLLEYKRGEQGGLETEPQRRDAEIYPVVHQPTKPQRIVTHGLRPTTAENKKSVTASQTYRPKSRPANRVARPIRDGVPGVILRKVFQCPIGRSGRHVHRRCKDDWDRQQLLNHLEAVHAAYVRFRHQGTSKKDLCILRMRILKTHPDDDVAFLKLLEDTVISPAPLV